MKVFYYTAILVGLAQMLTNVEATAGSIRSNRKLQLQLVGYGGRPPADRFPLQLCEGDCDSDDQVRPHLFNTMICLQST